MNWIDFVIIILLVFGLARGFIDGFIKELASLLALILGIWGAIRFSSYTAEKLYDYFDMTGQYVGIIAFLITFVIIVILVHFVGTIIDRFVEKISLGTLNSLLGLLFGLFKTALILSVIFTVLNALNAKHRFLPAKQIEASRLYNPIADIAPALFPVIGEGSFDKSFDRLKKKPQTKKEPGETTV
jgi:membrane protein required for colicin V production